MNREDIIRMAREASNLWMKEYPNPDECANLVPKRYLELFAELVAAQEREACEHICVENGALGLAAAIRARGEK